MEKRTPTQGAAQDRVKHFEGVLTQLNARIAVLARVTGAELVSEQDVQQVLERSNAFFRQHAASRQAGHGHGHGHSHAHDRLGREWEELRGLLVLRCDLLAQALNEFGLSALRDVVAHMEASRAGMGANKDGFLLLHHLKQQMGEPRSDTPDPALK